MMLLRKKSQNINPNWPQILDHPQRIMIIPGFGSGKTDALLNTIKEQNDDDYNIFDKNY